MLFTTPCVSALTVVVAVVVGQTPPPETRTTRMCSEYGVENQNPAYMFCQLQEVIMLMNVTFDRAVQHGSCSHSTGFSLESYICEALRVRVMAQLNETCMGQSSCMFVLHHPSEEECPDFAPNRLIITQVDYTCILSEEITTRTLITTTTNGIASQEEQEDATTAAVVFAVVQGKKGVSIGVAIGYAIAVISAIVIVVLGIVLLPRYCAKSASPKDPITMDTDIGRIDATGVGDHHSHINPAFEGDGPHHICHIYEEILDLPVDSPDVLQHEGISTIATDGSLVQDEGMGSARFSLYLTSSPHAGNSFSHINPVVGVHPHRTSEEISDLHMDIPKVLPPEEIPHIDNDGTSADESKRGARFSFYLTSPSCFEDSLSQTNPVVGESQPRPYEEISDFPTDTQAVLPHVEKSDKVADGTNVQDENTCAIFSVYLTSPPWSKTESGCVHDYFIYDNCVGVGDSLWHTNTMFGEDLQRNIELTSGYTKGPSTQGNIQNTDRLPAVFTGMTTPTTPVLLWSQRL